VVGGNAADIIVVGRNVAVLDVTETGGSTRSRVQNGGAVGGVETMLLSPLLVETAMLSPTRLSVKPDKRGERRGVGSGVVPIVEVERRKKNYILLLKTTTNS